MAKEVIFTCDRCKKPVLCQTYLYKFWYGQPHNFEANRYQSYKVKPDFEKELCATCYNTIIYEVEDLLRAKTDGD